MKHFKEHIYSLEERQESDISPMWQILQVLFFTCCVVLGFTACFVFGLVMSTMQSNCILYSELKFHPNSTDSSGRLDNIKAVNSEFPFIYCDLVLWVPVAVSTFACFFAVMFVYCGRGGTGNQSVQETWRIIVPTVFFNLICFVLNAYTANVIQSGLKQFLRSLATAWKKDNINLDEISHLRLDDVQIGYDLIRNLSIMKHVTWLLVSFWGLNFLWILLRLLFNVDFQLVRTTIHIYPNNPNLMQKSGGISRRPSVSGTSTSTSSSKRSYSPPSIRFRTVQFTPSTVGPQKPPPELLNNHSPTRLSAEAEEAIQSEEVELAEVNYNEK